MKNIEERLRAFEIIGRGFDHRVIGILDRSFFDLERIARYSQDEQIAKYAEEGKKLIRIASGMIGAVSAYVSKEKLTKCPLDLNECVEDAIFCERSYVENHNVSLERNLDSNLPQIMGSRPFLTMMYVDLLRNASHAIIEARGEKFLDGEEGKISVATSYNNRYVNCAISDNGVGMSRERINEVMKSLEPDSNYDGVGLPSCLLMMELHDGGLEIESEPGEGTTVTTRIPYS